MSFFVANLNILIIYAHDGKLHEAAVLAFAEYLRDVFNFEVHVSILNFKML